MFWSAFGSESGVWGAAPTLKTFVPLCAPFVAKHNLLATERAQGGRREVLVCLWQCVAKLKMGLNEIAIVNAG